MKLNELDHNFIICADDTSKSKQTDLKIVSNVVLFSTNISTELFEYAHGFNITPAQLKERLIRNADTIFDDSCKEWLRTTI